MKTVVGLVFLAGLAMGIGGCSKKTCETIADECDLTNDFEDDCINDYKDNKDCKDALKDFKDCVEEDGCGQYDCVGEQVNVLEECDRISGY
jgi:hypothetical protein